MITLIIIVSALAYLIIGGVVVNLIDDSNDTPLKLLLIVVWPVVCLLLSLLKATQAPKNVASEIKESWRKE